MTPRTPACDQTKIGKESARRHPPRNLLVKELSAIVARITGSTQPAGVLATLVTVAGSSYRRPGARLLFSDTGERHGSISGGCLEEDVVARARDVASTGRAELVTYDTTSENDLVWGVGLGCHGVVQVFLEKLTARPRWASVIAENLRARRATSLAVVWRSDDPAELGTRLAHDRAANGNEPLVDPFAPAAASDPEGVFFETIQPPVPLVIFGAGDDVRPLARFAKELGWHVTVADPCADFVTPARFPEADTLIIGPASELVARAAPPAGALAVVMTHRYLHDVPVLRDLLPRALAYIGLLGPKLRAEKILSDLRHDGLSLTDDQRAHLHAPVGLDIGAVNPEEVALSIIAEMRATLARRDARPLRERKLPIHEVSSPLKPNFSSAP